jgi:hypothetical protein
VLEKYKPYRDELLATDEGKARLERLRKAVEAGLRLGCHCAGKDGTPEVLTADDPLHCHGQLLLRALSGDGPSSATSEDSTEQPSWYAEIEPPRPPHIIRTREELAAAAEALNSAEEVAFDVETYPRDGTVRSLDPRRGKVV